jgi:acyl dehydratase
MVFGGYTAALVIGLSSQDTSENALELSLHKIRFGTPVFAGDTIIAFTEVLGVSDADDPAAGIVHFKHWGVNQNDKVVFEGERKVLVKRRGGKP